MITPEENIKTILADWLDALRRHDIATVEGRMNPEVFWQGVREDFVCANRHEAIEMLLRTRRVTSVFPWAGASNEASRDDVPGQCSRSPSVVIA
jgi:hypothetical protein